MIRLESIKYSFRENTIYCGDNIDVLKQFPAECINLCYIDPPFGTNRTWEIMWGDGAEMRSFQDRLVKSGNNGRYDKDINTYSEFIEPRIKEIHRVLKKTGSFYLHCSWQSDAYLRIICDKIFGYDNLLNRILWKRTSAHNDPKKFGRNTDTILLYAKSSDYTFNPIFISRTNEYIETYYNREDTKGRYGSWDLTAPGINRNDVPWRGFNPSQTGRHWAIPGGFTIDAKDDWKKISTTEKLESLDRCGYIIFTKNGTPRFKRYLNNKGQPCQELWDDIKVISSQSKERIGYPTQKPIKLIERIISASSNVNDLIMDAFMGSGTTVIAAKQNGRKFIGIDISPTACRVASGRIYYPVSNIVGMPRMYEDMMALPPYEFQNQTCILLSCGGNINVVCGKRGADGGWDGIFCHYIPIQVKKQRDVGAPDINQLVAQISPGKQFNDGWIPAGIFVAITYNSGAKKRIAEINVEKEKKIYYYTLDDLLNNVHYEDMINLGSSICKKINVNVDFPRQKKHAMITEL